MLQDASTRGTEQLTGSMTQPPSFALCRLRAFPPRKYHVIEAGPSGGASPAAGVGPRTAAQGWTRPVHIARRARLPCWQGAVCAGQGPWLGAGKGARLRGAESRRRCWYAMSLATSGTVAAASSRHTGQYHHMQPMLSTRGCDAVAALTWSGSCNSRTQLIISYYKSHKMCMK